MSTIYEQCNILTPSLSGVLEHYVGKKKELINIERHFEDIIQITNEFGSPLIGSKDKGNPEMKGKSYHLKTLPYINKINKEVEYLFGFKSFTLMLVDTPVTNAFTFPNTLAVFDPSYTFDDGGVAFNERIHAQVTMFTGLITMGKFTAGELTAVLLHEIGHIMDTSAAVLFNTLATFSVLQISKSIIYESAYREIPLSQIMTNINTVIEEWLASKPGVYSIIQKMHKVRNTGIVTLSMLNELTMISFFLQAGKLISGPFILLPRMLARLNPLMSIARYNMEKNADKFPIDYGYAKEHATAQAKFKNVRDTAGKVPVINWAVDYYAAIMEPAVLLISGYPSSLSRIKENKKVLQKYIDDPTLSPEIRKSIAAQIKDIDKTVDEYLDITTDENKRKVVTAIRDNIFHQIGHLDPRELTRNVPGMQPRKYKK